LAAPLCRPKVANTDKPQGIPVSGKMKQGTAYATVIIATHGTTFIPQNETSGATKSLKS